MRVFVVIGHQRKGSFCHAIVRTAVEQLAASGHEVIYHDLYEEDFDPILREEEISGEVTDPALRRQIDEVLSADGYVVVHPNWWSNPPAMLRGWQDRVLRQGAVYKFTERGVQGLLRGRKAVVFTTSNTPRDVEMAVFGDPLENLWKTCVFGFCGVEDFYRRNFESIIMSTPEQRKSWLDEVRETIEERFPALAAFNDS